jgi:hypothetical protein
MGVPKPIYPRSSFIINVDFDRFRLHKGDGDMWPITWAADGNLYAGAGDNTGSPMNFWQIIDHPEPYYAWNMHLRIVHSLPIDPKIYCQRPHVHSEKGVKPAGLISIDSTMYFAVELHNYGEDSNFNRQRNISSWIITTDDFGQTWNKEATQIDFFTGRLSSPHFLQFGKDYNGARDEFVYTYFPTAEDGNSYWCNGDFLLLGRVHKDHILNRTHWEFYSGLDPQGAPIWNKNDDLAAPVFNYPLMTGENHVVYNAGIKRYIMGNYSFIDGAGNPRPYHQSWPESSLRSQLTLFEAPEPWGPWTLFHQDDDWGTYGDYQPNFPTKWISEDGKTMWMVSSGSYDDYNFTVQKLTLEL